MAVGLIVLTAAGMRTCGLQLSTASIRLLSLV